MRVTFGRYLPRNSIIHKMDPRFKFIMIILLIVCVFLPVGYTGYLVLTTTILILFAIAKLSWRTLYHLLPAAIFIFVVILLLNFFLMHPSAQVFNNILSKTGDSSFFSGECRYIFFKKTGSVIKGFVGPNFMNDSTELLKGDFKELISLGYFFNWKILWFSEKALYSAFLMAWRISLMVTLTTILTGTTQPLDLTLAVEDLLWPLKLIGIPVYIFSMIISIALRMIPTLIDEAHRIMKAQASRGIDMKNGKAIDKIRALTSLIIPLLVSSFQKAEDLAFAMDSRGYNPHGKRTRYVQFHFRLTDLVVFGFGITMFALFITYIKIAPISGTFLHIPYIDLLLSR